MTIVRNCMICGKEGKLEISPKIYKQYQRYQSGIGLIQDIELPAEQREFLKTGMCLECQYMIFDEEDDDE